MVESFSLFCDDLGGIVHHFHCSENLLVAFKYIDLICLFGWVEFKCDWCGVSIVFEYNFCTMLNCPLDCVGIVVIIGL